MPQSPHVAPLPCSSVRLAASPTGRHHAVLVAACAIFGLASGCAKEEKPIERYQVAVPSERSALPAGHGKLPAGHPELAAAGANGTAAKNTRMLAALIPRGAQTWFFKVTGPAETVDPFIDQFRELLRSIRFPKDSPGEPTWTLPEGWRQDPAKGMRYATVRFGPKDQSLAMSVIPLQTAGDADAYALSNINRWRGQLGLAPITAAQIDAETESIELPGGKATMVQFLGTFRGDGMGAFRGPMAGVPASGPPAAGPAAAGSGKPSEAASGQANGSLLTCDTPEAWVKGKVGGMRKAAFQVARDGQHAEITVIDLAAAAGDLLPNVNRWRGQVKLEAMTQAELDAELAPIEIDGRPGHYIRLFGPESANPREAILGVIVVDAGKAWFVKMKGNAELVEQERDAFEAFVRSIKFATQ